MYSHILGRAGDCPEMRRIVEPPMHIDSQLSSGIQLADWIAASVTRAIDYQLVEHSRHAWVMKAPQLKAVRRTFTHESKLHLYNRSVKDIVHSHLFRRDRPLYPTVNGSRLSSHLDPDVVRRMRAAAERSPRSGDS